MKEIKLPTSWKQVTIKQFIQIHEAEEKIDKENDFALVDVSLNVLSVLSNTPIEELEKVSLGTIQKMFNAISFINTSPIAKTSSIKWKKVEEITYSEYISLLKIQNDIINNLPKFITLYCKNEVTEEEAMNMSVEDVFTGFFLLVKTYKKSINHLLISIKVKMILNQLKQKVMKKVKQVFQLKTK